MKDNKDIPEYEKWIYESHDGEEPPIESIRRGIKQVEEGKVVSLELEQDEDTKDGGNPMGKFGPSKGGEVVIILREGLQDMPKSISLQVGEDLVIQYQETHVENVDLPVGLFTPSGLGVSERVSRSKDGRITRSATAGTVGKGDIVINGTARISCSVS